MDKTTLKKMDEETYIDYIRRDIYDNISIIVNVSKGHTEEMHVEMTDLDMIKRIILEGKERVSCFNDQQTMEDSVADVICHEADKIAGWYMKEKKEFKNENDYQTITLNLKLKSDAVGKGFDINLKERISDYVTVVLERDNSGESIFGFYLKTAYANIEPDKSVGTGKRYNKDKLLNNPNFLKDDKWKKLRYEARIRYPEYTPVLVSQDKTDSLLLRNHEGEGKAMISYINEANKRFRIPVSGKRVTIPFNDAYFRDERFVRAVCWLENRLKEFEEPQAGQHSYRKEIENSR